MDYELLQNDVVTRLSGLNPNPTPTIEIVALPEKESDFKRNISPVFDARIVVAYMDSDYGVSFDVGQVEQEEEILLNVEVQAKLLYGNKGLYNIYKAAQALLLGYSPTNCDKIHFKKGQLQKTEDGLFYFVLICKVKTYAIEIDDTQVLPLIQSISYNQIAPL